jgi:hypothetical protein
MIDHLNKEKLDFLSKKTSDALVNHMPCDTICMIPNRGNIAIGRLKFIDVERMFSTELFLCDQCAKMITDFQYATIPNNV